MRVWVTWVALMCACGEEAPAPPAAMTTIERHGCSFKVPSEMRVKEASEGAAVHFDVQDQATPWLDLTISLLPDHLMPHESAQRDGVTGLKAGLKADRIVSEVEIDELVGPGTKIVYELRGRTCVVRYFTLWGARNSYVVVLNAELATEAATLEKFRPVLQSLTLDR